MWLLALEEETENAARKALTTKCFGLNLYGELVSAHNCPRARRAGRGESIFVSRMRVTGAEQRSRMTRAAETEAAQLSQRLENAPKAKIMQTRDIPTCTHVHMFERPKRLPPARGTASVCRPVWFRVREEQRLLYTKTRTTLCLR